jgi:hypothetical protein
MSASVACRIVVAGMIEDVVEGVAAFAGAANPPVMRAPRTDRHSASRSGLRSERDDMSNSLSGAAGAAPFRLQRNI